MNHVILVGRLVRDPEARTINGSKGEFTVANFTVAVDDWDGGKKERVSTFVPCRVSGQQAEYLSKYGAKGREVAVHGRLRLNEWADKETGEKKSRLELATERVELIGGNGGGKGERSEEGFSW